MPVTKKVGGNKPAAMQANKRSVGKPAPREEAVENEGAGSEADAFDGAKPQGQVEPGKYYAVIEEFLIQEPDEKGQSARIKYGIANEGDFRGVQVTGFYKLFEAGSTDEKPIIGKGASYLKKDMAVLGYGDVKFKDMPEAMEEIVAKDMGVIITVKQNQQWSNVYLGGLAEDGDDTVAEYLDQRTF